MFLLSARAYLQHGVFVLLFLLAMRRGAALLTVSGTSSIPT